VITLGSSFGRTSDSASASRYQATAGLDDLTKWAAELPGAGIKANKSAIGSVGYFLKKTLKDTVNGNTANWPRLSVATGMIAAARPSRATPATWSQDHRSREQWAVIRQNQRMTAALAFAVQNSKMKFWGQLAAMAVYQVIGEGESVLFGFMAGTFGTKAKTRTSVSTGQIKTARTRVANEIGEDMVGLARRLTDGDPTWRTVDRRMQNYMRAIGLFCPPIGTPISLPSRPLIGPHYLRMRPEIPAIFREKFWASFARKASPSEAWLVDKASAMSPGEAA
jgi:hypothetical protein